MQRKTPRGSEGLDRKGALPGSCATPALRDVQRIAQGLALQSMNPRSVLALQAVSGNHAVAQLLARRPSVQRQFDDQGQTGEGSITKPPGNDSGGDGAGAIVNVNPDGLIDGHVQGSAVPHAFVDNGQVATGKWHHCGGSGGKGNENTGAMDATAPTITTAPATKKKLAKAWVQSGTGNIDVKRSYNGVTTGDNGSFSDGTGSVYITSKAASRMAKHEVKHVKKSKELHDSTLRPALQIVKKYRGIMHSSEDGTDENAAKAALTNRIGWNTAVSKFIADDTAANAPMLTVDQADMALFPDFYNDFGPKKVGDKNFDHFYDYPGDKKV